MLEILAQFLRVTMPTARKLSDLSRQELYDLIWSKPAIKLSGDFGVSNVAVAKRCIRLNVPRPSAGYWASLAAGGTPKKKPLPPTAAEIFAKEAQKPLPKALPLPDSMTPLHPLAADLLRIVKKAELDSNKRARLYREPTMPEVIVSKTLAERVAIAFHIILSQLEPLGILFRKSQSSYDSGFFKKGHDRLYLRIEEDIFDTTGTRRQVPSWESNIHQSVASGHLTFSLKTRRYGGHQIGQWFESAKVSLERVLSQIVTAMRQHYLGLQIRHAQEAIEQAKRHAEWERRQREWEAQEIIRLQKEKERKHAEALAMAAKARKEDLLKAAEWWQMSCGLIEFINECDRQWKCTGGELTAEQNAWLTWAREYACALSPFAASYPNPVNDGAFDADAIPVGGPYPAARNFSGPPCSSVIRL